MGQYYRPCILKKNWKSVKKPIEATLLSFDFNNGQKLVEHSFIGNWLVRSMEYLLANQYKGMPFVWVGDYAKNVKTKSGTHNLYEDADRFIYRDYDGDDDRKSKAYVKLRASIPLMYQGEEWERPNSKKDEFNPYMNYPYYRYLVNYSKKEYCIMPKYNKKEWRINPLPILTCSGNGLGSGDYCKQTDDYDWRKDKRIGSWAFDRIGLTNKKNEIEGFTLIDGYFIH